MSTDENLFLYKIKNKRAYADRLSSDSDNSVQNMADDIGAFRTVIASDEAESEEENDRITKINFSEEMQRHESKQLRLSPDGDFPELPDNIRGQLPCDIFYIDDNNSRLQTFESFDHLSEYIVNLGNNVRWSKRSSEREQILNKLLSIPINNISHYLTIGQYLRQLYESDLLIDVIVDVGGERFTAHRIALCCHSNYFSDLFNNSSSRRIPFQLKIKGISPNSFAAFLEYCYTGEIKVYPEIAADMLVMADVLKVHLLKEKCDKIIKNISLEQTVKLMVRYKGTVPNALQSHIDQRVIRQFSSAVNVSDFLEIDIETFCRLMASDDLFVLSEYEVYQTAIRWLIHDIEERNKYNVRVMGLVRFCYMTQRELFTCVETTKIHRNDEMFREMVLIANWIITSWQLNGTDPFGFPFPQPRLSYTSRFVHQVSNETNDISSKLCNISTSPSISSPLRTPTPKSTERSPNYFSQVPSMTSPMFTTSPTQTPVRSPGYGRPVMLPQTQTQRAPNYGKPVMLPTSYQTTTSGIPETVDILVVGGFVTDSVSDNMKFVEKYDTTDNDWVRYCQLPEPRRHHAVATLNGNLYLVGGSDPRLPGGAPTAVDTVFTMDMTTKHWSRLAGMHEARHSHCVAVLNGRLYAIGGKGVDDTVLSTVESYNPTTDRWSYVASMATARFAAAAARLGNGIMVVGGLGETDGIPSSLEVLNTVEMYDPNQNRWYPRTPIRVPRCHACLVNVGEQLFLCGGATRSYDYKNSVLISLSSIDVYIEKEDIWGHRSDMVVPRHDVGVAVAGERIYIVGGISTTADRVLQSIECYDTRDDAWMSGVTDLPYPARWICCAAVVSEWQKNP